MASLVLKEKCRNSGAGAAQSVPLAVRAPRSVARSCRVPCGLGSEPGDGGGGKSARSAPRGRPRQPACPAPPGPCGADARWDSGGGERGTEREARG